MERWKGKKRKQGSELIGPKKPIDLPDHKRPNIILRVWAWLNGKKSVIGTTGGLIGVGLTKIPEPICQAIGWFLQAVCWPLTSLGILHKVGKKSKIGKPGEFKKENFIEIIVAIVAVIHSIISFLKRRKDNA